MLEKISKRAVIYCRVSTKEQAEEGNSLVTQERTCKEYALQNGYEVVFIFIEQGESAKTRNRTELNKLMVFCADRANKIDAVVAYKIDRISRNVDDYSHIRLVLKRYKVEIKSTSENIEDTPVGRFMENMLANVSQFDNDIRTERCVNGMKDAIREGRHIGKAPYGYTNMRLDGKSNIYPNDKKVFVEKAFLMIAKNNSSINEVRLTLARDGMINATGMPFSKSQFYRLLQNEIYAGWIAKFKERHRGVYDPLVSEELFKSVQYVLKRKSHKGFIYQKENKDFPLRRFVYNKENVKLTGYWAQGRKQKYPYYRFIGIRGSDCGRALVEKAYVKFLGKYKFNDTLLEQLKESLIIAYKNGNSSNKAIADKLKAKISDLKDKQNLLIHKNMKGVISDFILKEQMDLVEQELQDVYKGQIALNEEILLVEDDWDKAVNYLKNPEKIWTEANFEVRKKLQWFEFPHGVIFDNGKFRTTYVTSVFNAKNDMKRQLSHSVDRKKHRSNKLPPPKYKEYTKQIKDLSEIFTTEDTPS